MQLKANNEVPAQVVYFNVSAIPSRYVVAEILNAFSNLVLSK